MILAGQFYNYTVICSFNIDYITNSVITCYRCWRSIRSQLVFNLRTFCNLHILCMLGLKRVIPLCIFKDYILVILLTMNCKKYTMILGIIFLQSSLMINKTITRFYPGKLFNTNSIHFLHVTKSSRLIAVCVVCIMPFASSSLWQRIFCFTRWN
jgi:hypothetical protein